MGPPREHRLAPSVVTAEAERAGFRSLPVSLDLPHQYVLAFTR